MKVSSCINSLLLLASSYQSAPLKELSSARSSTKSSTPVAISLPISRQKHHGLSKLARVILGKKHTFRKYQLHFNKKKNDHEELETSSSSQPASAPLINIKNELFSCPVTIGSGQSFYMDLDTGSSDTWVRGPECMAGPSDLANNLDSCKGNKLDITDTALVATSLTYQTRYGSGQVMGKIYKGPVSIGGLTATIPLGVSTFEEGFDDGGTTDGLIGLGFDSISTISSQVKESASFVDNLGLSGTSNMFAFYLNNYNDLDKGEVTFGGYDSSKFQGEIKWLPLTDRSFWQFSWVNSTISIDGKSFPAMDDSKFAIADTGTTLIALDDPVATAVNSAIGGKLDADQGVYLIDCDSIKSLPSIDFSFGGSTFTIPPSVYVFEVKDAGICFSGISGGAAQLGSVILGDIFLRQYYSIYDRSGSRVGFALAKHSV